MWYSPSKRHAYEWECMQNPDTKDDIEVDKWTMQHDGKKIESVYNKGKNIDSIFSKGCVLHDMTRWNSSIQKDKKRKAMRRQKELDNFA